MAGVVGARCYVRFVNETRTPSPRRINVAVTPETVAALNGVMDAEKVNLTEAVRRLVGYGDYVYRAAKHEGAQVLVRNDETTREVVLL